jgi:phosphoglycolate phosphatase-like HAD superfamily hydrolase
VTAFNLKNNILALDFDGVIVDSIKECLVSGYNAYANFNDKTNIERFEQLDPEWASQARLMRNFIRNGEDYVFIAHALANGSAIKDQDDFDAFLAHNNNLRDTFFDHMVNQRISFSDAKPDLWAALNPLYKGMKSFLQNYTDKENFYIITTKKLLFVHKILAANDIHLIEKNLFDTAGGKNKRQIIEKILQARQASPNLLYFIDDQVDTLLKVKPSKVQVSLAEWGYNNEQQVSKASTNDIDILGLQDFFQKFV